ncbi:Alpha-galactosidase [Salmonella enterica subsp. enterica]|uniref:Alpha-galactosidase n=1 Tax=Salmonella enterica I TaxID=59201 RepID=A0A379WHR9_SALET|nr:Alpha-galactosidase [Salmonella enterica subsp. enterica]
MLNYVNPMAMNTWAMYARYPHIKQVACAIRYRERRKNWRAT